MFGRATIPSNTRNCRRRCRSPIAGDRRGWNITGYIAYHTFSGVHLRPYWGYDDDHFPTPDLRAYKLIGAEATKRTGYPAISIFHEFKYDPKTSITGSTTDWFYDHIGVYSWTTEFWSPQRQAGIEDYGYIEWMKEHPTEDDLKLLRWNDEQLDGEGLRGLVRSSTTRSWARSSSAAGTSCTAGGTCPRSSSRPRSRRTRTGRSGIC